MALNWDPNHNKEAEIEYIITFCDYEPTIIYPPYGWTDMHEYVLVPADSFLILTSFSKLKYTTSEFVKIRIWGFLG